MVSGKVARCQSGQVAKCQSGRVAKCNIILPQFKRSLRWRLASDYLGNSPSRSAVGGRTSPHWSPSADYSLTHSKIPGCYRPKSGSVTCRRRASNGNAIGRTFPCTIFVSRITIVQRFVMPKTHRNITRPSKYM